MLHAPMESGRPKGETSPGPEHFVYVIDDEAQLRESSCFLLAALGLSCVQYASGSEFLADVGNLEQGCILLDVIMRDMDGLDVQAELNRRGIDWPIIFMSGHQDTGTVVEAVRGGAVDFLEKPFSDEQLLRALHRGFVKLRGSDG